MRLAWIFSLAVSAHAADLWLARVSPVLTKEERSRYLSLNESERESFRANYFEGKALAAEDYFARVAYVDENFGSGQPGSGANTDQGRVYLALGTPASIHRLPSSRVFVPSEVWFYDHVPGIGYSSRLQLLFFRQRDSGYPKLYNPQLHTIRALLLPQSSTRGMFPVNDIITPNDVLNRLNATPAETEIVEAAFGVARGITGSGNSEILALAANPAAMLDRATRETVRSRVRFSAERPKVIWTLYRTADGDPATDIVINATAQAQVSVEIPGVDVFETQLSLPAPRAVTYSQRVFLLPGRYYVVVSIDGMPTHYQVDVVAGVTTPAPPEETLSYRANLYPGAAAAALGRQHLRAGRQAEAHACFARSLAASRNADALTGLAKLAAMNGQLDLGRAQLEEVLRRQPAHFEALVTLAAITAEFQDWPEATRLYRQALAIRKLPALESALKALESKGARP